MEEDELICGNSICAGFVSANWLWREKFPAPLKRVGEENKKMVMTDPIADMLTRIRNAIQAKKEQVDMPASRFKLELARILKAEGYIKNFKLIQEDKKDTLRIFLKYDEDNNPAILGLQKVSTCGRRLYVPVDKIPVLRKGMGVVILSTNKGLLTDKQARKQNLGGEVICKVW